MKRDQQVAEADWQGLIESLLPRDGKPVTYMTGKGGLRNHIRAVYGTKDLTFKMIWDFMHSGYVSTVRWEEDE